MEENSLPIEFFIAHIKSFADVFPAVTVQDEEWGLIFEWPNSNHISTNIALIYNVPKINMEFLLQWMKEDLNRKIVIPEGIKLPGQTTKEYGLGIYFRKKKKINSPVLDTETIRSYSYSANSLDFDLKDIMNNVTEINDISEDAAFEFHRLIGGNMHLNEGEIWSLDNDGAVLSTALTVEQSEFKNIKLIDLLATRKAVRQNGHAGNLLQSIIANGKKFGYIIIAEKNLIYEKLLKKFDFELINSYDVHILKK
ncbi:MAG: hypothetical protein HeimC2_17310 [Candidatus Heimdallarchaeota archaeon LC_2]|nr:MAG: hypothetical protein HeimC2_17310 [Candidatus Heimdallarchaeota archaeon LC_2]